MRARPADVATARRQAQWIAAIDPWLSLGYSAPALARWLGRSARLGQVIVTGTPVAAIIVVQPDVLLGNFIALLAVRPEHAGSGLGRALIDHVAARTWKRKRWLYVSSDLGNRPAARFYKRVGFERVARIPDLVRQGRVEVLWRMRRPE
ncbi:MAG TPA: GNAT family N-acetyltransferase [Polyangia bacterium]|nr:GNAT family N-acetyltransferase [Polyangia bacterium]